MSHEADPAGRATLCASLLAGAATTTLAFVILTVEEGHLSWVRNDPSVLAITLFVGAVLGVVVGSILCVFWLGHVPPWTAAGWVSAGALAGVTLGGLVAGPLPVLWLGMPPLGVGVATVVLRRRHTRTAGSGRTQRRGATDA